MRWHLSFLLLSLVLCAVCAPVLAAPPVIEEVVVDRGCDTDVPDWTSYHQRVVVIVSDADGAADIACAEILEPGGGWYSAPNCEDRTDSRVWQVDDYTLKLEWTQWGMPDAPAAGTYTVNAYDMAWTSDTIVTPAAPAVSGSPPIPTAPTSDTVIYDSTPTYEWTVSGSPSFLRIEVQEEGTYGEIWSADLASTATSAVYNFDDGASQLTLEPNHTCIWKIGAWSLEASDSTSSVYTANYSRDRFTLYGPWPATPPELPGKLAYSTAFWGYGAQWEGGVNSVAAYGTDEHARVWLGPVQCSYPDWSPDGTKLLYSKTWGQVWIDPLDGTPPTPVPGVEGGDSRWAADGERVVFIKSGPSNPNLPWEWNPDIWIAHIDGSQTYPLVDSFDHAERWPVWSPDGLWVAYRKLPAIEGSAVWLVRYDGTEDHPLVATGLAGYPGYEISIGDPAWSPDGLKLAVTFSAALPGASWPDEYISGIGVIPREGGEVTPVFVAGSEPICCGRPGLPRWSPDGTRIVFSSGHHLPDPVGMHVFDPRIELWLMNADGSGEPTRLTYDESFTYYPSWWAPNTEPGSDVEVVAGDTTVSFESVTGSGSTTAVTFDDPPGSEPSGFQFLGDYYDISTTATLAPGSKITIEIHYDDADVPGGEEEWLSLLHWENDAWVDITVRPIDTVNNIITGECYSLSAFGVAHGPQLVYPLPPINADGSSVFKLNRTVPVKFQLIATDGSYVSDAVARLYVDMVSTEVTGTVAEPGTTTEADTGYVFRYDPTANQYIFNLGTKGLSVGTWTLTLVADELPPKQVQISLR